MLRVLQPIEGEVEKTVICSCPAPIPITEDPFEILDTKEEVEAEKENKVSVLELPAPLLTPPRTEEDAVCFQHAICSEHKPNSPHPYHITFPTISSPGLSIMCEICCSYCKAH